MPITPEPELFKKVLTVKRYCFLCDFGRIDCVVNNAGAGGEGGPIAETSVEGFNQHIALLLGGTFLGSNIQSRT